MQKVLLGILASALISTSAFAFGGTGSPTSVSAPSPHTVKDAEHTKGDGGHSVTAGLSARGGFGGMGSK